MAVQPNVSTATTLASAGILVADTTTPGAATRTLATAAMVFKDIRLPDSQSLHMHGRHTWMPYEHPNVFVSSMSRQGAPTYLESDTTESRMSGSTSKISASAVPQQHTLSPHHQSFTTISGPDDPLLSFFVPDSSPDDRLSLDDRTHGHARTLVRS